MPPPASIGRYRLLWVDEQSHRLSALEDEINVYKKDVETLLIGDPVVALIEIGRFQPDLLVLDSQLESISPATICHAVKHHLLSEHLRIVMLKDVDHTDMVLPAGAHAVLTRPVTLPQVLTQLP